MSDRETDIHDDQRYIYIQIFDSSHGWLKSIAPFRCVKYRNAPLEAISKTMYSDRYI